MTVEWMFKEVKPYWAVVEMKSKLRVKPVSSGKALFDVHSTLKYSKLLLSEPSSQVF